MSSSADIPPRYDSVVPVSRTSEIGARNQIANVAKSGNVSIDTSNSASQPSNVINISNSNEIVIGPMMQYRDAVTIYQYLDATTASRFGPESIQGKSRKKFYFI